MEKMKWCSRNLSNHGFAGIRMCFKRYLVSAMSATITLLLVSAILCDGEVYGMTKKKHIVLLGASVGHAWDIGSLPERLNQDTNAQSYTFEFVGDYQFDKTQTLRTILQRKQNKPDAIILKECAAYFPGDLRQYQEVMNGWVNDCKNAKVVPVLTTVVPVTKPTNLKAMAKDLVKPLFGKANTTARLESLLQYNDWIRAYAKKEGLTVLDLEQPLRTSDTDRRLRADLHSGDGLHLNAQAYTLLDRIVIPTLDQAFRKK